MDSGRNLHQYLIERSRKGDRVAQSELYSLYSKAMYNICRRMLGNNEEAKDVLQDSFVQAFLKLSTLKDLSTFGGWLKRIVMNNCISLLRKRQEFSEINQESDFFAEDSGDFEDVEWADYQIQRLVKALDHVSDGCRAVLNLYVFEGYDHSEIAEILSISEVTSRAQYAKAKKKLKQVLLDQM